MKQSLNIQKKKNLEIQTINAILRLFNVSWQITVALQSIGPIACQSNFQGMVNWWPVNYKEVIFAVRYLYFYSRMVLGILCTVV